MKDFANYPPNNVLERGQGAALLLSILDIWESGRLRGGWVGGGRLEGSGRGVGLGRGAARAAPA
eukprot:1010098-Pelagomonas_calceolata.AAC.3